MRFGNAWNVIGLWGSFGAFMEMEFCLFETDFLCENYFRLFLGGVCLLCFYFVYYYASGALRVFSKGLLV